MTCTHVPFRACILRALLRLCALACLFSTGLTAQAAPVKFDIPAGSASTALQAFARQSGLEVLFPYDELKQVQSTAVKGEMEPADALNQLLTGTGYEAAQTAAHNFVVKKSAPAKHSTGSIHGTLAKGLGVGAEDIKVMIRETGQQTRTDKNGDFFFSSVEPGTYLLIVTADGYQPLHITDVVVRAGNELSLSKEELRSANGTLELEPVVVRAESVFQLEKVEVTDSKPKPFSDRNVDLPRTINDVQPYYIFDSQKIEESGTTDVEDFLRQRLTMDTTVQTSRQVTRYTNASAGPAGSPNGFSGFAGGSNSSISLNGLGADHTIVLVNGLPMAGVSSTISTGFYPPQVGQPDINGIPLGAIDRIEVLPSSAGAIYGAGAVGGVINIILKKAYTGGDIKATYASTWDGYGPSRTLEASFGKSFEHGKTQLLVTAQYSDQSPIYVGDRLALLNRGYATLLANDPSLVGIFSNLGSNKFNPPVGATPNIASATQALPAGASPLPFAPTALYYQVPAGTPGALTTTRAGVIYYYLPDPVTPLTLKSTGAALGGVNPYIATLPVGYSANSNPSSIIGGQWNLSPALANEGPNGLLLPLGNFPRRESVMATLNREMTTNLQLHADFMYDKNHSYSDYNSFSSQGGFKVPAESPLNPFNQAVRVSIPVELHTPSTVDTITRALTLGGTLKLPFDWIAHLDYQWSQSTIDSRYVFLSDDPYSSEFFAPTFYAANSGNSFLGVPDNNPTPLWTAAYNPFVDTLANPINFAPFLGRRRDTGKTTLDNLTFAASGPLVRLPWGSPTLSLRLQHDKTNQPAGSIEEGIAFATPFLGDPNLYSTRTTLFSQSQTEDKANVELDLPIFKSKWLFLRSLDAQFNVSTERSTTWTGTPDSYTFLPYPYGFYPNGATFLAAPNSLGGSDQPLASYTDQSGNLVPGTNAQAIRTKSVSSNTSITGPALSYKPTDDILIRASIASGYVPPTNQELLPLNPTLEPSQNNTIIDPKTGTQTTGVTVYDLGGNPALRPTSSKSWNLGAVWAPQQGLLKGLRLDAEYTKIDQHNLILYASAQQIVTFEDNFPGLVTRDSTGTITSVTTEYVNVAEAKQSAWTYSLDYTFKTPIGSFELTGAETIQEHNQQQIVAGTKFLEFVGYPNTGGLAKVKATGTLRWAWRNWVASWTTTYFGGYNQWGAPGDPGAYASALETGTPYTLDTTYTLPQGGNTIPAQMYHNLYLSYAFPKNRLDSNSRFGRWANAFLNDAQISLNVNNVFNSLPPFDVWSSPFYASAYGDVQLRNYSVSIKKSW